MFPIRNTTEHQGNLNARSWILQKLKIFHRTGSRAQLEINVRTREYFSILAAVIFERRTFESRRHYNFRRWRRKEIDQDERNNAHDTDGRSQSFEQLPTTVSQHGRLPIFCMSWESDGHQLSRFYFGYAGKISGAMPSALMVPPCRTTLPEGVIERPPMASVRSGSGTSAPSRRLMRAKIYQFRAHEKEALMSAFG